MTDIVRETRAALREKAYRRRERVAMTANVVLLGSLITLMAMVMFA